ncbi:membrane protein [Ectopseudomonas mendocina]|nr:membrane protein [Pseudomonas mendocina]
MAGSSLLALIDDISTVLDDVATMTKIAARKTAGVLGDDLALNAQQVTGVKADRELPVVWAVAKGSLVNKAILVPAALLISAVAPWLVVPLLMLGGLFLCYEGAEKLIHKLLHRHEGDEQQPLLEAIADPQVDLVAFERDKIRGAVRTDFVLSAEIIAITLGTVATASFLNQVLVLSGIALLMTVGVYGLVAGIVKLDDAGLYLSQRASAFAQACGRGILRLAPWLMKSLSVIGTAAMFMVGGGILSHGLPPVESAVHHAAEWVARDAGQLLSALVPTLLNALLGVVAGVLSVLLVSLAARLWQALRKPHSR